MGLPVEKSAGGPFVVKMFTYLCGFDGFWSVWYNNLLQKYVAVYVARMEGFGDVFAF